MQQLGSERRAWDGYWMSLVCVIRAEEFAEDLPSAVNAFRQGPLPVSEKPLSSKFIIPSFDNGSTLRHKRSFRDQGDSNQTTTT
jgi:hypothetical protein